MEQERLTLLQHLSSPPVLSGVCVTRSLVLYIVCMFCRSLFVLHYFLFWPLCFLFFIDIRILITPLVQKCIFKLFLPYSRRHYSVINHCDRCTNVSLILVIWIYLLFYYISSKFLLHLECYLLSPKRHTKISK